MALLLYEGVGKRGRLVATLGSRSSLRKVTRKAIIDVDLPKACDTISTPDAPMALRLQGSLLYGVSRVFSQKCGYVLTDAQSLQDKMKGVSMTSIARDLQIDPNVTSTRKEQLNLPQAHDMNFDLDLTFDLSVFDTSDSHLGRSSILSPRTLDSDQSSLRVQDLEEVDLVLPSPATPGSDLFGIGHDFGTSSVSRSADIGLVRGDQNEPAIYDESIFQMEDDGDVLRFDLDDPIVTTEHDLTIPQARGVWTTLDAASEVRHNQQTSLNHQEADVLQMPEIDDDVFQLGGEDDLHLPPIQDLLTDIAAPENASEVLLLESEENNRDLEITGAAPQRKARVLKPLQADSTAELSNRQLAEWNDNYLVTMAEAQEEKLGRQALMQAKKNAAFWMLSQGIGGVEVNFGEDLTPHPLAVFSGQGLLDALTGIDTAEGSRKRSRSVSDHYNSEDNSRRVKNRTEDQQANREIGPNFNEIDDMPIIQDDDYHIESEVGRQAPSSLKDRSSQMPWNVSSRQESMRTYGSGLGRVSSSVGGLARLDLGPPSAIPGRHSRLTSASPLIGKGLVESLTGSIPGRDQTLLSNLDISDLDDIGAQLDPGFEDGSFQLYGPAAAVDTQTALQDHWIRSTLENEALNFLGFLDAEIQQRERQPDNLDDSGEPTQTITLGALLPPETNSKPVGAQAMIHVLLLASRGFITVRQDDAFGDIVLGIKAEPRGGKDSSEDVQMDA